MGEFLVNTSTTGIQYEPAVAAFRGTHYLVAWNDDRNAEIKGQVFQTNGSRSGSEFVINGAAAAPNNTYRQLPTVAGSGGGPVVAWVERAFNPPGPAPHVKLQRFNLDGQKTGPELQVSTTEVDPKQRPSITNMVDGGFLVTWADASKAQRIKAQRFSIDGARQGAEFTVNTSEGFHRGPLAATLGNGNYVVAWRTDPVPPGGGRLVFRIFDLEGNPTTDETAPNLSGFSDAKALTALDGDSRFVIAHVRDQGESGIGVQRSVVEAHVFASSGAGPDITISATDADGVNSAFPTLSFLPDKRFLLGWVQKSAETFSTTPTVRARVFFDGTGSAGQEIQADASSATDRFQLRTATAFSGGDTTTAFVTWADTGGSGDTSDYAVRGCILNVSAEGGLS
ncbi:hypothetical protein GO001_32305 [Streptomyces sp. NRRL B-1677]|uniref:hypothetical protein n=1 Tax=Streptomyces sp. NRRL B-1677 TaxID=2682966 RepID=UPI001892977E|nr:hypothetical protein [Streptomyces sp. NRRL B-1677]MBF6049813.1 hypothetical protein [Streptomyces sp. NRRL B-1677]